MTDIGAEDAFMSTFVNEISLKFAPDYPVDNTLALVQVMGWCRQETSHQLNRVIYIYGVYMPQWLNVSTTLNKMNWFFVIKTTCKAMISLDLYQVSQTAND